MVPRAALDSLRPGTTTAVVLASHTPQANTCHGYALQQPQHLDDDSRRRAGRRCDDGARGRLFSLWAMRTADVATVAAERQSRYLAC